MEIARTERAIDEGTEASKCTVSPSTVSLRVCDADIALRFEFEHARRDGQNGERKENARNIDRFVGAVFVVVVAVALLLRLRDSHEVHGEDGHAVTVVTVEDGGVRRVLSVDVESVRERDFENVRDLFNHKHGLIEEIMH